jgi:hypothetical protein
LPYCPHCRSEYRAGYTRCADCDVELVDELPEEIWEEVPIEEALEEPRSRREWAPQFIPSDIGSTTTARCIKVLCSILIAVSFYYLLHHTAISLEYYFQSRIWDQREPVVYVGWLFFNLFAFERLLLIILALFLSTSITASHKTLKLGTMFCFAVLMAIWHAAGLVFLVITAVQNDIWSDAQAVVAFAAGVFALLMVILIGAATTLLSQRLQTTFSTVGA